MWYWIFYVSNYHNKISNKEYEKIIKNAADNKSKAIFKQ